MPNDREKPSGSEARRNALAKERHKRFYTKASVGEHGGGFALLLDGCPAKTPAKAALILPTLAAAEAVALEWDAQGEEIDLAAMPLTRIVNTAIDGVALAMEAVVAEIVKYAETDLVCYRASSPQSLVRAEAEAWDPILAFAASRLNARFVFSEGIAFVAQPGTAIEAVRRKVEAVRHGPAASFALASLSAMTTLTGSVLIALALSENVLGLEEAWRAAHVDEDFEMRLWGTDAEAMQRRARRFVEMAAADTLWRLIAA